ncbi:MAG: NADH:flavin oxidoreductase [Lachnospiraceae bacterium]|nr:NADH:flavin oxidoreductase [Lachnospiraceae bacterium]
MLNEALKIKNLVIKNRIAIPPMVCFNWTDENGYVTEKNIEHYRDLAKGGAGLVIVEATSVAKKAKLHENELGIWDDSHIAGLKTIVDEIHKYGAKTFIQLVNAGGNGPDENCDVPTRKEYRGRVRGVEMTEERINEAKEEFVKAALRAQEAGFDGVEIHGCHGDRSSCFFNSRMNLREDKYGKDKSLFAKEVLKAVKAACNEDFIVGIRIGCFEPTLEDGLEHCKEVAPYADFLDVSYGGNFDAFTPDGFEGSAAVYGAKCVKEMLPSMPVFGVHLINSKEACEKALSYGLDMVDVGKAALVDPAFANHVINGDREEGHCLHCKNFCKWNPNEMANPNVKCPGFEKYNRA